MKNNWTFFTFRDKTYLLIIFQVCILVGVSIIYYFSGIIGKTVYLKTEPIDFVREGFVDLNLEELTAPYEKWEGDKRPLKGEEVYIIFKRVDGVDHVKVLSNKKIKTTKNETMLKGKVKYAYEKIRITLPSGDRYYFNEKEVKIIKPNLTYLLKIKQSPFGMTRNISITEMKDVKDKK